MPTQPPATMDGPSNTAVPSAAPAARPTAFLLNPTSSTLHHHGTAVTAATAARTFPSANVHINNNSNTTRNTAVISNNTINNTPYNNISANNTTVASHMVGGSMVLKDSKEFSRELLEATRQKLVLRSTAESSRFAKAQQEQQQRHQHQGGVAVGAGGLSSHPFKSGGSGATAAVSAAINASYLADAAKAEQELRQQHNGRHQRQQHSAPSPLSNSNVYTGGGGGGGASSVAVGGSHHHGNDRGQSLDEEIEAYLQSSSAHHHTCTNNASAGAVGSGDGASPSTTIYEPYDDPVNDAPAARHLFGAPRRLKRGAHQQGQHPDAEVRDASAHVHDSAEASVRSHSSHPTSPTAPLSSASGGHDGATMGALGAGGVGGVGLGGGPLVDIPTRTKQLVLEAQQIAARALAGAGASAEVRQATLEADKEAHEEQLYLRYVKLQEEQDEIDRYRRNLGWDQLQGNFMGIAAILDSGNEATTKESEALLGDWDTYEKVQQSLKTFVFRRAPESSKEDGPSFVTMLKSRLHKSRETIDALNKNVTDLSEALKASNAECRGAQQLAKEQGAELQRMRSLNTALMLQMKQMRAHRQINVTNGRGDAGRGGEGATASMLLGSSNASSNANPNSTATANSALLDGSIAGTAAAMSLADQLSSLRNDFMELANANWKTETENRMLRMQLNGGKDISSPTTAFGADIPTLKGGADAALLLHQQQGGGGGAVSSLFGKASLASGGKMGDGGGGTLTQRQQYAAAQMQAHTRAVVALSNGRRTWRRRLEMQEQQALLGLDYDANTHALASLSAVRGGPSSGGPSSPLHLSPAGAGQSLALSLQQTNMQMVALAKAHLEERERKRRSTTRAAASTSPAAGVEGTDGGDGASAKGSFSPSDGLTPPLSMDGDADGAADGSRSPPAPLSPNSNASTRRDGWRVLHDKILGNFALSRAECMRREELHLRRMRHKIALLTEELANAAADRDLIADYYARSEEEIEELQGALLDANARADGLSQQVNKWNDAQQKIVSAGGGGLGGGAGSSSEEGLLALANGFDLSTLTAEERSALLNPLNANALLLPFGASPSPSSAADLTAVTLASTAQLRALAKIFSERMTTAERQLKAKEVEVERLLRENHTLLQGGGGPAGNGLDVSLNSGSTRLVITASTTTVLSDEVRRLESDVLKKERTLIAYEQEIRRLRVAVSTTKDELQEGRAKERLGLSVPTAVRVVSVLRAKARRAVAVVAARNDAAARRVKAQEAEEERARKRALREEGYGAGSPSPLNNSTYTDDGTVADGAAAAGLGSAADGLLLQSPLHARLAKDKAAVKAERDVVVQLLLLSRRDDHTAMLQSLLSQVTQEEGALKAREAALKRSEQGGGSDVGHPSRSMFGGASSMHGAHNGGSSSSAMMTGPPSTDETTWCSARRLWLRLVHLREEAWRSAATVHDRYAAEQRLTEAYASFMQFEQMGDSKLHPAMLSGAALRVVSQTAAPITLIEHGIDGRAAADANRDDEDDASRRESRIVVGGNADNDADQQRDEEGAYDAFGESSVRRDKYAGNASSGGGGGGGGGNAMMNRRARAKSLRGNGAIADALVMTTLGGGGGGGSVSVDGITVIDGDDPADDLLDGSTAVATTNATANTATSNSSAIPHAARRRSKFIAAIDVDGNAAAIARKGAAEVARECDALRALVKTRASQLGDLVARRDEIMGELQRLNHHHYPQGGGGGYGAAAAAAMGEDGGGVVASSLPLSSLESPAQQSLSVLYYRHWTASSRETFAQAAARFGIADLKGLVDAMMLNATTTTSVGSSSPSSSSGAVLSRIGLLLAGCGVHVPTSAPTTTHGSSSIPHRKSSLPATTAPPNPRAVRMQDYFGTSDPFYVPLLSLAQLESVMGGGVGRGIAKSAATVTSSSPIHNAAGSSAAEGAQQQQQQMYSAASTMTDPYAFSFVARHAVAFGETVASIASLYKVPEENVVHAGCGVAEGTAKRIVAAGSSANGGVGDNNNHNHNNHSDGVGSTELAQRAKAGTPEPNATKGVPPPTCSSGINCIDILDDGRFAQVVDVRIPSALAHSWLSRDPSVSMASDGLPPLPAALLVTYPPRAFALSSDSSGDDGAIVIDLEMLAKVHNVPLVLLIALNASPRSAGVPVLFPCTLGGGSSSSMSASSSLPSGSGSSSPIITASVLSAHLVRRAKEDARLRAKAALYAAAGGGGGFVVAGTFGNSAPSSATGGESSIGNNTIDAADGEAAAVNAAVNIPCDQLLLVHDHRVAPSPSSSSSARPPLLCDALSERYGLSRQYLERYISPSERLACDHYDDDDSNRQQQQSPSASLPLSRRPPRTVRVHVPLVDWDSFATVFGGASQSTPSHRAGDDGEDARDDRLGARMRLPLHMLAGIKACYQHITYHHLETTATASSTMTANEYPLLCGGPKSLMVPSSYSSPSSSSSSHLTIRGLQVLARHAFGAPLRKQQRPLLSGTMLDGGGRAAANANATTAAPPHQPSASSSASSSLLEVVITDKTSLLTVATTAGTMREAVWIPCVQQVPSACVTSWLLQLDSVGAVEAARRLGSSSNSAMLHKSLSASMSMSGGSSSGAAIHAVIYVANTTIAAVASLCNVPLSTLAQCNAELSSGLFLAAGNAGEVDGSSSSTTNHSSSSEEPMSSSLVTGYVRVPVRSDAVLAKLLLKSSTSTSGSSSGHHANSKSPLNAAVVDDDGAVVDAATATATATATVTIPYCAVYATVPGTSFSSVGAVVRAMRLAGCSSSSFAADHVSIFDGVLDPTILPSTPSVMVRGMAHTYYHSGEDSSSAARANNGECEVEGGTGRSSAEAGSMDCLLAIDLAHPRIGSALLAAGSSPSSSRRPLFSAVERDVFEILQYLGRDGVRGDGKAGHVRRVTTIGLRPAPTPLATIASDASSSSAAALPTITLHVVLSSYAMGGKAVRHLSSVGSSCGMPHTEAVLGRYYGGATPTIDGDGGGGGPYSNDAALMLGDLPLGCMSLTVLPCAVDACEVRLLQTTMGGGGGEESSSSSSASSLATISASATLADLCLAYKVPSAVLFALNPTLLYALSRDHCVLDKDPMLLRRGSLLPMMMMMLAPANAPAVANSLATAVSSSSAATIESLCAQWAKTSGPFTTPLAFRLANALAFPLGALVRTINVPPLHCAAMSSGPLSSSPPYRVVRVPMASSQHQQLSLLALATRYDCASAIDRIIFVDDADGGGSTSPPSSSSSSAALYAPTGVCLKLPMRPSAVRADGHGVAALDWDPAAVVPSSNAFTTSKSSNLSHFTAADRERIVTAGDTLASIAEEAGMASVRELALLNPSVVKVREGALVGIPIFNTSFSSSSSAAVLAAAPDASSAAVGSSSFFRPHRGLVANHAVQSASDTLQTICALYNQGLPAVLRANPHLYTTSGALLLLVPLQGSGQSSGYSSSSSSSHRDAALAMAVSNLVTIVVPSAYDTLSNLARRFEVPMQALTDANRLVMSGGHHPQQHHSTTTTAAAATEAMINGGHIIVPIISSLGRSLARQQQLSLYLAVAMHPHDTIVSVADRYGVFAKDVIIAGRRLQSIGVRSVAVPITAAVARAQLSAASAVSAPSALYLQCDVGPNDEETPQSLAKSLGAATSTTTTSINYNIVGGGSSANGSANGTAPPTAAMVAMVAPSHQHSTSNVLSVGMAQLESIEAGGLSSPTATVAPSPSTNLASLVAVVPMRSLPMISMAIRRERARAKALATLTAKASAIMHAMRGLAGRNEATQRELQTVEGVRAQLAQHEQQRRRRAYAARDELGLIVPSSSTAVATTTATADDDGTITSDLPLLLPYNMASSSAQTMPVAILGRGYVAPIRIPSKTTTVQTNVTSDAMAMMETAAVRAEQQVRDAKEAVERYREAFDKLSQTKADIENEVLSLQRSMLAQQGRDADTIDGLKVTIGDLKLRLEQANGVGFFSSASSPSSQPPLSPSGGDGAVGLAPTRPSTNNSGDDGGAISAPSTFTRSRINGNAPLSPSANDTCTSGDDGTYGTNGLPSDGASTASKKGKGGAKGGGGKRKSVATIVASGGGAPSSSSKSNSPSRGSTTTTTGGAKRSSSVVVGGSGGSSSSVTCRSVGVMADLLTLEERCDRIGFGGVISQQKGGVAPAGGGGNALVGSGGGTSSSNAIVGGATATPRNIVVLSSAAVGQQTSSHSQQHQLMASNVRHSIGGGGASAGGLLTPSNTVIIDDVEGEHHSSALSLTGGDEPLMVMSKSKARRLQAIGHKLTATTAALRTDLQSLKASLTHTIADVGQKTRVSMMPLVSPSLTLNDLDRKVQEMQRARQEEIDSRVAEGVRLMASLLAPQMSQLFDHLKKRRAISLAPFVNHSKLFHTRDERDLTNEDWVEKRLAQYVSDSLRSADYNVLGESAHRLAALVGRVEGTTLMDGTSNSHTDRQQPPTPLLHDRTVDTADLLPAGLLPPLKASMASGEGSALDSLKASTMAAMRGVLAEMEAEEEARRLAAIVPRGVNVIDVRSPLGPSPREIATRLAAMAAQRQRGGGEVSSATSVTAAAAAAGPSSPSVSPFAAAVNGRRAMAATMPQSSSSSGVGVVHKAAPPPSTAVIDVRPASASDAQQSKGSATNMNSAAMLHPAPPSAAWGGDSSPMSPLHRRPHVKRQMDAIGGASPSSPSSSSSLVPPRNLSVSGLNQSTLNDHQTATATGGAPSLPSSLSPTALKQISAFTPNRHSQVVLSRVFGEVQQQLLGAIFGGGAEGAVPPPLSSSAQQHPSAAPLSLRGEGISPSHSLLTSYGTAPQQGLLVTSASNPLLQHHLHYHHQSSQRAPPHTVAAVSPNSQVLTGGGDADEQRATIAMRTHAGLSAVPSLSSVSAVPSAPPAALRRLRAQALSDGEKAVVASIRETDQQLQKQKASLLLQRVGTNIRVRRLMGRLATSSNPNGRVLDQHASAMPHHGASSSPPCGGGGATDPIAVQRLTRLWQGWLRGWVTRRTTVQEQQRRNTAALAALFSPPPPPSAAAHQQQQSSCDAEDGGGAATLAKALDVLGSTNAVLRRVSLLQQQQQQQQQEDQQDESSTAAVAQSSAVTTTATCVVGAGSGSPNRHLGIANPALLLPNSSGAVRSIAPPPANMRSARQPSSSHFRDVLLPSEPDALE